MSVIMDKERMKELNLSIANFLKLEIESFNKAFDINICLFQPGIEPLSIIDKSENEIITELRDNIIIMLSKFYQSGNMPLHNWSYLKLFGMRKNELLKLSGRVITLNSVINYSKKDEEFSKMSVVGEAITFVDEKLNKLCFNMLTGYFVSLKSLIDDFNSFTLNTTLLDENLTSYISSPQAISDLFRITYKDNEVYYCTIADAIQSHQDDIAKTFNK